MSVPGFSPDGPPTFAESQARASVEADIRLEVRRRWRLIVVYMLAALVAVLVVVALLPGGESL